MKIEDVKIGQEVEVRVIGTVDSTRTDKNGHRVCVDYGPGMGDVAFFRIDQVEPLQEPEEMSR